MGFLTDLRYSIRLLAKTPVTTGVAVLSLALGIGANVAVFSLINALILTPLAIPDPQSLVSIETLERRTGKPNESLSVAMFEGLQQQQRVFSSMFLWSGGGVENLEVNGTIFAGSMETVSGDYFSTLGIQPVLGRLITRADVELGNGRGVPVAVLDFRCWKARFRGDPGVIGRTLRINGTVVTVIGVAPESFHGLVIDIAPEAAVPIGFSGNGTPPDPKRAIFRVFGRLRPGVTIGQARAQLETIWPGVRLAALPTSFQGERRAEFLARPIALESFATGTSWLRQRMTRPLEVLMTLAGLVLLVACVNLANLMLARAAARKHEIAIRLALGGGAWQIGRQFVVDGLVLSTAGAICGVAMAVAASRALARTAWSGFVPLAIDTDPDARVLAFTAMIALAAGVAFGLAPWRSLSRTGISGVSGQRTRSVRAGIGRFGQVLVSSQIAVSLVLLMGATLFARSLGNLYRQNPGFRRDGVLIIQLFPSPGVKKIPHRTAYFHDLADQLARIPGVHGASYSDFGPVSSYEYKEPVEPRNGRTTVSAVHEVIGPGFFDLVGMHVLEGRQLSWNDDENSSRVAMVSDSLARQLFPGQDAVGQRIKIGSAPEHQELEIVGVVNSASLWSVQAQQPPAFYLPLAQESADDEVLVDLRVDGDDPMRAAPFARSALLSLGEQYALSVETLSHRIDRTLVSERLIAILSGFLGVLAMLLAVIGLYGVMSLSVAARTAEIGVRMALGAQRRDVIRMVLGQVLRTTAVGFAFGAPIALGLSQFLRGMIFGLSEHDPGSLILAASMLLAAALIAGFLPARHAAHIDPMEAVRAE